MGEYDFPDGDAAAIRVFSLARIVRDLGLKPIVIGKGRLREEHFNEISNSYQLEGVEYKTMNPAPVTIKERLKNPLRRAGLYVSTLRAMDLSSVAAVVLNACGSAMHLPRLKSFCERTGISFICDVCEWYDPCQFRYGRIDPGFLIFRTIFHGVLPRVRNYIVVSRLLENHFARPDASLIRVAAPFDVRQIDCTDNSPSDRLTILYAGSPGRKDYLREIIVGLSLLSEGERSRLEFQILGADRSQLDPLLGSRSNLLIELKGTIKALGRVPREKVLQYLRSAHFSVLVRPDKRYANAGFPSKVAESLAAGTPVMANFTSDLALFLKDGEGALRIAGCGPSDVADAIRRALAMPSRTLKKLRETARAKAEEHFDYRGHLVDFRNLLGSAHNNSYQITN